MYVCVVLGEKQISDDEIHKRDIGWLTESDGTYGIYKLHHYLEQLSTFWHKTVVVYIYILAKLDSMRGYCCMVRVCSSCG